MKREFRRYLDCGILARGFARARCEQCGHGFLIAFSCKGRGVCPPCNARRMVATAAHLTDHVLPDLPLRQWVLAVPKRLRYVLERDADLQGAALRLFLRAVESCRRAHSPGSGPAARLGAVAFIHRFGSSLNARLHFRCVVIDGVFEPAPAEGVVFRAATELEDNAIAQVQACVRRRLLRYCARPPFALDRLRERDPEHLLCESAKPGPGGNGPELLTPLGTHHHHRSSSVPAHPRLLRCWREQLLPGNFGGELDRLKLAVQRSG